MALKPYKNRPVREAREIGRIVEDIQLEKEQDISPTSTNIGLLPSKPPGTSEGGGGACCCDHLVYVSKDGTADFVTIQDAIDYINATETPNATDPWVVQICPGEYAETLVGVNYVSLIGTGPRDSVVVSGATGPLYTTPNVGGNAQNIKFALSPTTLAQQVINLPGTHVGPTYFWECTFDATSATNDITSRLIAHSTGTVFYFDCNFVYSLTGTAAGIRTHNVVDINGAGDFRLYRCDVTITIGDVDDTAVFINESSGVAIQSVIIGNIIRMYLTNANYSGTAGLFYLHGDGTNKFLLANQLLLQSAGDTTDTGYLIYMDTTGGGGIVNTIANHGNCDGFSNSYSINVALGDQIRSHFDKVYAASSATGLGDYHVAGSYSDGEFTTSSHVNVGAELRCWLGAFYAGFEAPVGLAGNRMWGLPLLDGALDHVLVTDGAFQTSFKAVTALVGVGDVVGPAGATDHAICRFDGVTGKLIQDSLVIISDAGDLTMPGDLIVDGGDIGLTADTDLIQIAVDSFKVNGAAVFNEAGLDMDFRVESANVPFQVFLNAGTDTLLVGAAADIADASVTLHIAGNAGFGIGFRNDHPPRARMYKNGAQNMPSGGAVPTKVEFDADDYDSDNITDPTVGHDITPGVEGWYKIEASVRGTPSAVDKFYRLYIYIGGVLRSRSDDQSSFNDRLTLKIQDTLLVGNTDEIDIRVYHNKGVNWALETGIANTHFEVHRVS